MNLLEELKDRATVALTGRKKREKITFSPVLVSATIPQSATIPATTTGEPMASITYHPGAGKKEKAAYWLGRTFVPASVMTRITQAAEGKSEQSKAGLFYSKLVKKYKHFLEAMDVVGMTYTEALAQVIALKPVKKTGGAGIRAGKTEKTAEAMAKAVCKRFRGTPAEIVASFETMVSSDEFKKELTGIIAAYQKQYGTKASKTGVGFTKTSSRTGNPKAIKALAAARVEKIRRKQA